MTPQDYDRERMQAHFLESWLSVLVIALFMLALAGFSSEWLIALAVVIAGVLANLQRRHRCIAAYHCPGCGKSPHSRHDPLTGERHEPAAPHCLHCGKSLSD